MKISKKSIREAISLKGVTYEVIPTKSGNVLVSDKGILGYNDNLITWSDIDMYKNVYNKQPKV
jgi:hypothetical protein